MATKKKKKAVAKVKAKPAKKVMKKPTKKPVMKMKTAAKPAAKAAKVTAKPTAQPKMTAHSFSAKMLSPLDDRIVVRVQAAEEKTAGGLYIPGTVATRPDRGEVMAKGPGHRNKKGRVRPLDLEIGDTILFPQYTGTKVSIGDNEFLIMREEDVLGVVET